MFTKKRAVPEDDPQYDNLSPAESTRPLPGELQLVAEESGNLLEFIGIEVSGEEHLSHDVTGDDSTLNPRQVFEDTLT